MCGARRALDFPDLWKNWDLPPIVLSAKVGSFGGGDKKKTQQSDVFFLAVSGLFAVVSIFRSRYSHAQNQLSVLRLRRLVSVCGASGSSMLAMARTC